MRNLILLALALLAVPAFAQAPVNVARSTLLTAYDLDGEAADADHVVASAALADSTSYTVAANPDVCRLVDATVTDADSSITAGVLTIVGTDCFGVEKTGTYTFVSGGSAVYNFTMTGYPSRGAYYATVTSVDTGVLTGEGGGDTLTVGYTSDSENGWAMWGKKAPTLPGDIISIDPFGWFEARTPITTSGANTATLDGVLAAADAFALVSAGDLLQVNISGTVFERKITAKASDDQVTVNASLNIPAAGVTYRYKKQYFSTDPWDVVAVPVHGHRTLLFDWSVDANANTGGVVTLVECTAERVEFPTARWVQIATTTVATGTTQANTTESINLELLPYNYCRFGLSFGTGDDADAADEDINLAISLMR